MAQQAYTPVELPTQRLLPIPMLHAVAHDDEGYAWYATTEGLLRDDGYRIETFRSNSQNPTLLGDNAVLTLADDHRGHLWFGTWAGLYYIDKRDNYAVRRPSEPLLCKGMANAISVAPDSTVWVACGRNMFQLRDTTVLQTVSCPWQGNGSRWVDCMVVDRRGTLWVSPYGGERFQCVKDGRLQPAPWPDVPIVSVLREDALRGGLWAGTWGGSIYWLGDSLVRVDVESRPRIMDLALSADGHTIWCVTMEGLYQYEVLGAGSLRPVPSPLLGKAILDHTALDRDGNLWVASYSPHSFILRPRAEAVSRYSPDDMLRRTGMAFTMDAVCCQPPYLYVWQNRTGTSVVNHNTGATTFLSLDGKQGTSMLMEECRDGSGDCWSYSDGGIVSRIKKGGDIDVEVVAQIGERYIDALHDDGHGHLWIGTNRSVWCMDTRTREVKRVAGHPLEYMPAMQMVTGRLYVGGKGGLAVLDGDTCRSLMTTERVECMAADDCVLWVGTSYGSVMRVGRDEQVERVGKAGFADDSRIMSIAVDRQGHVWMQATHSVKEYSPATGTFRVLRADDPSVRIDYFNTLRSYGDSICFGGSGGYCMAASSTMLDSLVDAPAVLVSAIDIDSEHLLPSPATKEIEISHRVTNIAVHLTTLRHLQTSGTVFAYRLRREGENVKWATLPVGSSTVYITRPSRGTWLLDVMVTDENGHTAQPSVVLILHRLPAWWETWWAFTLYALCFAAASVAIFHGAKRVRRIRNLYKELAHRRRNLMLTTVEVDAEAIKPGVADEDLVKRATALVEKHIADADYSVERLAADLCMSRMSLYRHIQTLVGQSPVEFIRTIRLKQAARLIKKYPNLSIADVAERCGYSSMSYFSRQFKGMFGASPSEYKFPKDTSGD